MKIQQRKFVVERKSGRRRHTVEPASIWRGTDLQALVRQVEADAPHLFEPIMASDTRNQEGELQAEPRTETFLEKVAGDGDENPILATPALVDESPRSGQGSDMTTGAADRFEPDTPVPQSPKMVKRRRAAAANPHVGGRRIAPAAFSDAVQVEDHVDELASLEEENRRLRRLLAHQLHMENTELRKKLARFSATESRPFDR